MNPPPDLAGAALRTYEAIFRHPAAHNLDWHDVRLLLGELGQTSVEPNGNLKVTRHGHTLVLHPPRTKEVAETKAILELRHFLELSEAAAPAAEKGESHWLVVINHHEARLFRSEMHGAVPQQILPHEPADYFRHAHNAKDFSRGQEKPDPNSFFEPVAHALTGTGQILLFGTGKGTSSEMEQFVTWLKKHHADLVQRIVGTVVIDERHLTEPQLLAKAREFYRTPQYAEK